METLQQLDTELFIYLNNLGSVRWDGLWLGITYKWNSIPIYIVLLILVYKNLGLKKTGLVLLFVALLITCTDQLANLFKHGFERLRPCRAELLVDRARFIAGRCGSFGYFSAHAASSMSLAIFLGSVLRKKLRFLLPVLIIWAFIIGYSRIYVGVHYPGDVLTGIVIGGLIGYLFYRLFGFATAKLKLNTTFTK
ncbi:phosphatase PAP2 family protein [Flavimarina sp. Hel_I_48]|uniref:phosphatase PAP2 family protein n=1 Tax=Flavimarina sp. Hel_I_48 TaxID=1392488 RepID=UPI0004DF26A5|nr:phosphatase PAP2 family protein [Flavimarina sp. Hel_I_48]